jgi:hypothetical protein
VAGISDLPLTFWQGVLVGGTLAFAILLFSQMPPAFDLVPTIVITVLGSFLLTAVVVGIAWPIERLTPLLYWQASGLVCAAQVLLIYFAIGRAVYADGEEDLLGTADEVVAPDGKTFRIRRFDRDLSVDTWDIGQSQRRRRKRKSKK